MQEMTLVVGSLEGRRRFLHGIRPIDDSALRDELAALPEGARVVVACSYVSGVGLRAMRIVREAAPALSIQAEVTGLIERGYHVRALQALAAHGEEAVRADLSLLSLRAHARAESGQPAARADAEEVFARAGAVLPRGFSIERLRTFIEPRGAVDAAALAWAERTRPAYVANVLDAVPLSSWPSSLLGLAVEQGLSSSEDLERFFRELGKKDPQRAALLAAVVREKLGDRARSIEEAKVSRLASRPSMQAIGDRFGIVLPRALSAAWSSAYEHPTRGFILVSNAQLDALESTARAVVEEQRALGGLPPIPGKPYPILPFAEADAVVLVLDLSRPDASGDFPVLRCVHDSAERPALQAVSSKAWLQSSSTGLEEE